MNDIKVSVVIPVYNVEKYVARTLECIINQTYRNLEIIVVDDGTKDNSGIICDEYAKKDSRITVYHKINRGLSSARNTGIEKATGDYVWFLDSDDFIAPNAIQLLLNETIKHDADIAICKMKKVYPKDKKMPWNKLKQKQSIEYSAKKYQVELTTGNTLNFCLVGTHLYKAELLKKCAFDENLKHGEDIVFNYIIANYASKIIYLPMPLMAYYQREGSLVNSSFATRRLDVIKCLLKFANEETDLDRQIGLRTWAYYSALESFYFMMRDKVIDIDIYTFLYNSLKENKPALRKNKLAKLSRRIFAPIGVNLINIFIKKENKQKKSISLNAE